MAPPPNVNITFSPDRASGIYEVGEPVGWTVRAPMGVGPTRYTWTARENNGPEVATGVLDLSSGEGRIEARLQRPGMLYVRLAPAEPASVAPAPTEQELSRI